MVSISTPVCVNFELRPGAGDIHICWFNFDALAQGNAYKPTKEPINYRGPGGDRTHDLQTEATPPAASCPARTLHATEIAPKNATPMTCPWLHWTTDNLSGMHMVSISTPVCVNFELRPGAGDIHICWFNFDALAQGNAYKPTKEPINYRGPGGDRTHDLQTEATPPAASCPARTLHATEIAPKNATPMTCPWLHWTTDNLSGMHMVSISTPVCVNFELRPGAGDIHICWFNFDALAQGNAYKPTKEPINYRGPGGDRTHDLQTEATPPAASCPARTLHATEIALKNATPMTCPWLHWTTDNLSGMHMVSISTPVCVNFELRPGAGDIHICWFNFDALAQGNAYKPTKEPINYRGPGEDRTHDLQTEATPPAASCPARTLHATEIAPKNATPMTCPWLHWTTDNLSGMHMVSISTPVCVNFELRPGAGDIHICWFNFDALAQGNAYKPTKEPINYRGPGGDRTHDLQTEATPPAASCPARTLHATEIAPKNATPMTCPWLHWTTDNLSGMHMVSISTPVCVNFELRPGAGDIHICWFNFDALAQGNAYKPTKEPINYRGPGGDRTHDLQTEATPPAASCPARTLHATEIAPKNATPMTCPWLHWATDNLSGMHMVSISTPVCVNFELRPGAGDIHICWFNFDALAQGNAYKPTKEPINYRGPGGDRTHDLQTEATPPAASCPARTLHATEIAPKNATPMTCPWLHWTTDNLSGMHMVSISTPVCVNFELRPGAGDIHICWFNFDALAQGNAYKPTKEPINYRGPGGDRTHDLQTEATPPAASCPARTLHATEIAPKNATPMTCPWLHWTTDNLSGMHMVSISTPVCVNFELRPGAGDIHICWFNFDALAQGNAYKPTKEPINYRGPGGDRTHDLQTEATPPAASCPARTLHATEIAPKNATPMTCPWLHWTTDNLSGMHMVSISTPVCVNFELRPGAGDIHICWFNFDALAQGNAYKPTKEPINYRGPGRDRTHDLQTEATPPAASCPARTLHATEIAPKNATPMTCPWLHWTTDNLSGMHMVSISTPVCVNFELRPGAGDIHICWFNFDALAQGNAYKPTKEPINYRGPGGDRTHDLQTAATPPAASCPARTLHATEIAPKNATPMTCPWLHWTTDNLSGMHMVSISTPVCVNFELRPGAGDIHICWFNFDALAQGNAYKPTKEPINYRGPGGDRTHDLQTEATPPAASCPARTLHATEIAPKNATPMTCPWLHWTTDNLSGMHMVSISTPVCVNFELRPGAGDIHICWFNFDALAQGNAYKPTKEPINYRGPGGDRTHDLQTEATPPAASCPARTLHATEIAPKNATPMTCPWLHWTTDNLSGMHMVSISTPVCVNFELRPGAGDIHICWFNFDALAQGNAYKPTKEPINYRGPGRDRTHDLQTEATPPAASCPARTLHATEIAPKNATPMTCPWLHWTTDNLSGMHMVSISTPVCVNFELRPGAGDIHICWFNFDALAQGNAY